MSSSITSILILAGIAVFLILKLRSVLGTRDGFEAPPQPMPSPEKPVLRVVAPEDDRDISDHAEPGSRSASALAEMKKIEPSFRVDEFLSGARAAYEMILMGFERGEIEDIRPFLSDEVYASFAQVIADRTARGETIDAEFIGVSGTELTAAEFLANDKTAELTISFKGELTSVVRDASGEVLMGDPNTIVTQRDVWTFARQMGSADPNWKLVATGG